jgi:hypothetical protein
MINSRMMRWEKHIVCMGEARNIHRNLVRKLEGKRYLERPGIMGKVILQWILKKYGGRAWTGFM